MSEFIKGTNWSKYSYRDLQQELATIRLASKEKAAEVKDVQKK